MLYAVYCCFGTRASFQGYDVTRDARHENLHVGAYTVLKLVDAGKMSAAQLETVCITLREKAVDGCVKTAKTRLTLPFHFPSSQECRGSSIAFQTHPRMMRLTRDVRTRRPAPTFKRSHTSQVSSESCLYANNAIS